MSSGLFGDFDEILSKWLYLVKNNDFLFGLASYEGRWKRDWAVDNGEISCLHRSVLKAPKRAQ